MIDIDELKRDREAGTPGPWTARWPVNEDHPFIDAECNHEENPRGGNYYMNVSGLCLKEDGRRIARVPDLEAAYIAMTAERDALAARVKAADELAQAADKLARFAFSHMTGGRQDLVDNAAAALRAYRATAPQKEKSE